MIKVKKCEQCSRKFIVSSPRQRFCTKSCRVKNEKSRIRQAFTKQPQLCWDCKNVCGDCSWSSKLKPIKGWTARPIHRIDAGRKVDTYSITACPEFVRG